MSNFEIVPATENWPRLRARFLFRQRRDRAHEDDIQLTASQAYGVISQSKYNELSDSRATAALAGTDSFLHVDENDFVISLRTFEGGIERARERGCISPAYTVMRPSEQVEPIFFQYFLKSSVFIQTLQTAVTGIRDGKSVRYEQFSDLVLPTPDLETQEAIAAFLDRETARIDQLIEKKQRLVELLAERELNNLIQAFAALSQETGVWKIAHICVLQRGRFNHRPRNAPELYDGEYPFLQTGDVAQAKKYIRTHKQTLTKLGVSVSAKFPKGTVLMAIAANVGDVAISEFDAYCPDSLVGFIPTRQLDREYLYYALRSLRPSIATTSTSTAQDNTNILRLGALKIPLPMLNVQRRVVDALDRAELRGHTLAEATQTSIDRLREYRSALITAAVTGQIDVTTWGQRGETDRRLDEIEEEMSA